MRNRQILTKGFYIAITSFRNGGTKMGTRKLVTIDNWDLYTQETSDGSFFEYLYATESYNEKLESLLNKNLSFKELKQELTVMLDERKTFVKHGREHHP
jgi:hypothetical protein